MEKKNLPRPPLFALAYVEASPHLSWHVGAILGKEDMEKGV